MIVHGFYIHLCIINHLSQDIKTLSFFLMKANPIYTLIFAFQNPHAVYFCLILVNALFISLHSFGQS